MWSSCGRRSMRSRRPTSWGWSQRDDLAELWREMARLEAQFARRVAELDTSVEWSLDGSRSAAGWLVANLRAASGEAHHRVKVARQIGTDADRRARRGRRGRSAAATSTRSRRSVMARSADAAFAVFERVLVDVACAGRPEDVANVGRQWRDALDAQLDRDGSERRRDYDPQRRELFLASIDGLAFLDATFDSEDAGDRRTRRCGTATNATTVRATRDLPAANEPTRSPTSSATTSIANIGARTGRIS